MRSTAVGATSLIIARNRRSLACASFGAADMYASTSFDRCFVTSFFSLSMSLLAEEPRILSDDLTKRYQLKHSRCVIMLRLEVRRARQYFSRDAGASEP